MLCQQNNVHHLFKRSRKTYQCSINTEISLTHSIDPGKLTNAMSKQQCASLIQEIQENLPMPCQHNNMHINSNRRFRKIYQGYVEAKYALRIQEIHENLPRRQKKTKYAISDITTSTLSILPKSIFEHRIILFNGD